MVSALNLSEHPLGGGEQQHEQKLLQGAGKSLLG